ncbi:HTH domain-containing protein [Desulforamulus aeronauticus DSM 10349]|uniref:HTH domain-containing protein n=2 Tax=Desulforamulus aeronauticus TaxID=53343 RepID=A0A1M6U968_9FIRM|nr:HTH domain-containing protein [Desulforamulus aeronauticus DSM 10349]
MMKRAKHNHQRNLEIVIRELRLLNEQGGASLEHLALQCDVSIRQIYRYLNELQNLGYQILKAAYPGNYSAGRYLLGHSEQENRVEYPLLNMLQELDNIKNELSFTKLFLKEMIIRIWLNQLGIVLPFSIPILAFHQEDAIKVSKQTMIYAESSGQPWEEIKLRVSAKVLTNVTQTFSTEIISKQRQRDGSFVLQLKTKRITEMGGLLTRWGSEVDVLEPGSLRHKILENCKSILHANRLKRIDGKVIFPVANI